MKKNKITAAPANNDFRLTREKINDILATSPDYHAQNYFSPPGEKDILERSFSVGLKESEWNFIIQLLQDKVKQQNQLIAKIEKYPSDTIASWQTKQRKESIKQDCEHLIGKINEEFF